MGIALAVALVFTLGGAPDEWTELAPMPAARQEIAASVLDGRIYVAGGFDESGASTDRLIEEKVMLEKDLIEVVAPGFETLAFDVRILASGDPGGTIIDESNSDYYDLLVMGAENKMLAQPLFFGQGTAAIVERAGCTTVVVVPPTAPSRGD